MGFLLHAHVYWGQSKSFDLVVIYCKGSSFGESYNVTDINNELILIQSLTFTFINNYDLNFDCSYLQTFKL